MRTAAFGSIITPGLVLTVLMLTGQPVVAQPPGGFGAQMWMDRLDENEDGRLDPDELAGSRFPLADMAERAGIDASRGLDADDVEKVFENMRQQGGGFGPPGGFGGDRGGRRGGERGGRGGFDRGGSERGGRDGDRSSRNNTPEPPPRVTVDLQATYAPGDTNADGQLELSEWLRWKSRAALSEFLALDRNNDGILTPRELAQSDTPAAIDLARLLPGAHPAALQPGGRSFVAANPTMSGAPAAVSGTPTPQSPTAASAATIPAAADQATSTASVPTSADVDRHTATAQRFFKILDRDKDGKITDLEWRRSSRLRPKFEDVGADLTQPMSEEQFVGYYVKFSTSS